MNRYTEMAYDAITGMTDEEIRNEYLKATEELDHCRPFGNEGIEEWVRVLEQFGGHIEIEEECYV